MTEEPPELRMFIILSTHAGAMPHPSAPDEADWDHLQAGTSPTSSSPDERRRLRWLPNSDLEKVEFACFRVQIAMISAQNLIVGGHHALKTAPGGRIKPENLMSTIYCHRLNTNGAP